MSNNGHEKILFEVLMKEKLLEALLRQSVCQLGKERDNAFSTMKKSQAAHTLAVAKHENKQSELKQKLITVGLLREAWESEKKAGGVDVVSAGTAGGDATGSLNFTTSTAAGVNGSAESRTATTAGLNGSAESRTVTVDDVAGANETVVNVSGADDVGDAGDAGGGGATGSLRYTGGKKVANVDVEPDFDQDSEEFEALLLQNVLETEAKLANMTACDKIAGTVSDVSCMSGADGTISDTDTIGGKVAAIGAGSGGNGDSASGVNDTVVVDTPVGVNIRGTDLGSECGGISDTAKKLKDICLLIPMLESPNGKQNDMSGEKSKRKSTKASAGKKRAKIN